MNPQVNVFEITVTGFCLNVRLPYLNVRLPYLPGMDGRFWLHLHKCCMKFLLWNQVNNPVSFTPYVLLFLPLVYGLDSMVCASLLSLMLVKQSIVRQFRCCLSSLFIWILVLPVACFGTDAEQVKHLPPLLLECSVFRKLAGDFCVKLKVFALNMGTFFPVC